MNKTPKNFKPNFIYPEIKTQDRVFGAAISVPILRENGDWRDYLPNDEDQRVNGVESSACYIEAQQATIATLQEEQFGIKDRNYSARFNALLSGGTEVGGDPLKGAYSIKKDGLIPQEMMEWKDINSWDDFHSWKGVDKDKCLAEGKRETIEWDKKYKIVSEKYDMVGHKYAALQEALKRSPVCISVTAWYERGGIYYKPDGMDDNHMVEAVYLDDHYSIYIRDTYYPYIKILEPQYNFDFALSWSVQKKTPQEGLNEIKRSLINLILDYVSYLVKQVYKVGGEFITGIFSKRN